MLSEFWDPKRRGSDLGAPAGSPTKSYPELNAKILAVEDFPNQKILYSFLKEGHQCIFASNAEEAAKMRAQMHFDIILDGLGATKVIREIEKEKGLSPTVIITLTANAFYPQSEGINSGTNDYLVKPYSRNQLRQKIQHWLTAERLSAHKSFGCH